MVGVMGPRFLSRGGDVDLMFILRSIGPKNPKESQVEGQGSFALVGPLKPGVTGVQASSALEPIFEDLADPAALGLSDH